MKFIKLTANELVNAELIERMYIEAGDGKYFVMVKCADSDEECASDCAGSYATLEEATLKLKKILKELEA